MKNILTRDYFDLNNEYKLFEVKNLLIELFQGEGFYNPHLEVFSLLENILSLKKAEILLQKDKILSKVQLEKLEEILKKRLSGYPLQYILGEWDFLGLTLSVGEGVLIPRPETELLCEHVVGKMKERSDLRKWVGIDLCAGSGCIGLGISSLFENSDVPVSLCALEFSDDAFNYLWKNCKRYPELSVKPIKGDIFVDYEKPDFVDGFDFIVSNPPYLRADEMEGLDENVKKEPSEAFVGGIDGLDFYRIIAERWIPKLRRGGICSVEVGLGQSDSVADIFKKQTNGLGEIEIACDYNGIERIVSFKMFD